MNTANVPGIVLGVCQGKKTNEFGIEVLTRLLRSKTFCNLDAAASIYL